MWTKTTCGPGLNVDQDYGSTEISVDQESVWTDKCGPGFAWTSLPGDLQCAALLWLRGFSTWAIWVHWVKGFVRFRVTRPLLCLHHYACIKVHHRCVLVVGGSRFDCAHCFHNCVQLHYLIVWIVVYLAYLLTDIYWSGYMKNFTNIFYNSINSWCGWINNMIFGILVIKWDTPRKMV